MSDDAPTVDVEGRHLKLSNLDKVLYPETGFTKRDVLAHYLAVGPTMLGHLRDRPVTFRRAPDGVAGQIFYEKHVPRGAPSWLRAIEVAGAKAGSTPIDYPAIDNLAGLIWAANLAVLEFHVPMWRVGRQGVPKRPDLLVVDLDPGAPAGLVECCRVALVLRQALADDGLTPVAKTSGSKGLQLYAPIGRWRRDSLEYAHDLARRIEAEHRDEVVSNMRKDLRPGKVLIDWSQNNPAKTTVAPYSLRLTPVPGVSTPLRWEEVETVAAGGDEQALRFTPEEVAARLAQRGDLAASLLGGG